MNAFEMMVGILEFVMGGNATFSLLNDATGGHLTFKVSAPKGGKDDEKVRFVSVLNGPDNYSNYMYVGCIFDGKKFTLTKSSKVSADSKSFKTFSWFFDRLVSGKGLPEGIHFYHAGKCGRCGRKLTVPESIVSGFGPECVTKIA